MATDKTTLVVMAAGMGSRFGGLKQIVPLGPGGEVILDYSIYDAKKAGFDKVVFIIKKEIEKDFREIVGRRAEKRLNVEYAFQSVDSLPAGLTPPPAREKPWGTAHAVLSCAHLTDTPFAVINADDYYGHTSFALLHRHLAGAAGYDYAMAGFRLLNTLTENGTVARGVCEINGGVLKSITERTKIQDCKYTEDGERWIPLPPDTIVSMNMWGFTPTIFGEIEAGFPAFFAGMKQPEKDEYFLPLVVDNLIKTGKATVQVIPTEDKWYGVTYQEDKPRVQAALLRFTQEGLYHGI